MDFIFWENEMRLKYKIPYDLDTIKLLEAYCGTDDVVESKVYSMMAYSEVTGDPFFTSGKMTRASPLIVHEDELDEHLYSWQKRQRYRPKLGKDQYEIMPEDGSGSGKYIQSEPEMINDQRRSFLIVDVDDDTVGKLWGEAMKVRVRENNGKMRWATLEELNYCREKEYPKNGWTPHNKMRGNSRKFHKKFCLVCPDGFTYRRNFGAYMVSFCIMCMIFFLVISAGKKKKCDACYINILHVKFLF